MFSNNPTALPRKLKIAPTTVPTIAGNASTAFSVSLMKAAASFLNHFFKAHSFFGGEAEPPLPSTHVIESTIVVIFIERTVSTDIIIIPNSRDKVQILSAKDVSLSRTFSMICFILATCVQRLFFFCLVFLALLIFHYSSHLAYPYTATFSLHNK